MPRDDRFIHSGCAVAAAVVVRNAKTGVVNRAECWASSALPLIGGKASSSASTTGGWGNVLKFSNAVTVLTGGGNGKQIVEDIQTFVETLTVFDTLGNATLTAKRVEVHAVLTFDRTPRRLVGVEINGSNAIASPYTGLLINGQNYSDIVLEADLADGAGKDHAKFLSTDLPARRKGQNHPHRLNKIHTTLAKDDNKRLTSTPTEHGYLDVPDFGRIYFAEWIEEEERQSLTGLRIFRELPPDEEMEIVIADPYPLNGSFYP